MTAFTTIAGMVPLAIMSREGAELWKPMGIGVIGGLLVSTVVTLVLVPVVYTYFERFRNIERRRERLEELKH